MENYDDNISGAQLSQSPVPSPEEVAIMSRLLGALLFVGVPPLECIFIAIEVTPNLRLQKMLDGLRQVVREDDSMVRYFSFHLPILGHRFVAAAASGEIMGNIGGALLQYAKDENLAQGKVAHQIGRSDELILFTETMAKCLEKGNSILAAVCFCQNQVQGDFKKEIEKLKDSIETGCTLTEAMAESSATFDRMYRSMIEAGERDGNEAKVFPILATL